MNPEALLDRLVTMKLVDREDIARVAALPRYRGRPIELALIDASLVPEPTMHRLMNELYKIEVVELGPDNMDAEQALSLPRPILETYCVYPLRQFQAGVLPLAMADPFDVTAQDLIRHITGLQVVPVLAPCSQIQRAVRGEMMGRVGFDILAEQVPFDVEIERVEELIKREPEYRHEKAPPIIVLVNSILADAIRRRASDIHLEPQETHLRLRYRIDGVLQTVVELPKRIEKACVTRIKIISGMDIAESRRPQDGRTSIRLGGNKVDLRVSVLPTSHGETVVLRILDKTAVLLELDQLGFLSRDLNLMQEILASSNGMILHTGPTGSGKTSSLYAALRRLNDPTVNIATVEDPIEFQLEGISQVQVNNRAGVTFASSLRAFLRQDPDIIMVGEIRDLETAEIAVHAAQTGHLVLSTLHTNDAPTTLTRLILMGLEPHVVAGSLILVVAQRLVRRLCPACRGPAQLTATQQHLLSLAVEGVFPCKQFRSLGCEECEHSGYRGRIGLYELLPITTSVRAQMLAAPSEDLLWEVARDEGMRTLLEDGIAKVEMGLTSLDEVLNSVTIKRKSTCSARCAAPPDQVAERLVAEVMSPRIVTLEPAETLARITERLLEHGITGGPVVDKEGRAVGVISFNDVAVYSQVPGALGEQPLRADQIMSKGVISVGPDDPVGKAVELFRRHKIHRLVVVDDQERPVGMLTPFDLVLQEEVGG